MSEYLRPYQIECRDAVLKELRNGSQRTLYVQPTGTGKTEVALDIIDHWRQDEGGTVLCLSHRQELVSQPHARWYRKTGEHVDIEQGDFKRTGDRLCFASKDSLHPKRLEKQFPNRREVSLIWVDEGHHLTKKNSSYAHILDYFDNAKMFACTATPDRSDEVALGQMFDSVAYDYPLLDPAGGPSAIGDGWLANIKQSYIVVESLAFENVGSRGGDFIDGQLERMLLANKAVERFCVATRQYAQENYEKQLVTLCFTAGVDQALAEAVSLNAEEDGSAYCMASRGDVDQYPFLILSSDKDTRRRMLRKFSRAEFQYLTNCAVFTEGFDEPRIGLISMGRPTKSRSCYAQMLGRGTRVLPNLIEGQHEDGSYWRVEDKAERLRLIKESAKPHVHVLDFVGNSKHSLVSSADILGGKYPDEVVALAKDRAGSGKPMTELLEEAEKQHRMNLDVVRRAAVRATAEVRARNIDPFLVLDIAPTREPGWHKGRKPTEKQKQALRWIGLAEHEIGKQTFFSAGQLIGKSKEARNRGEPSYKQKKLLLRSGFPTEGLTKESASAQIDKIVASGYKLTGPLFT